uniref:Transcription factor TFIIE alpha subunit C-terminal domain-containing protein n=1 Tax=Romanomermis culicivorax TaxID=13658 RepID=A0A915J5X0_ROMCU
MSVPDVKVVEEIPASMQKLVRLISKGFYGVEHNDLWNGEEMQCVFCRGVVEEDSSALPSQNARSALARFNEQMMPFFQLMQELDGIQLALNLLEPRPAVIVHKNKSNVDNTSISQGALGVDSVGSGHQQKSNKNEVELYKTGFTVNIEHNEAAEAARIAAASSAKQVPIWIQSSTIPTTSTVGLLHGQDETGNPIVNEFADDIQGHAARKVDIASALLRHETKPAESLTPSHVTYEEKNVKNEDEDFEEVNDETNDEEEEEDENNLEVKVKGKSYALADVMENPDLIEQMSHDEKDHYVKVSQAAYEKMYGE